MGRKTHGPYLIAAIEYNDLEKIKEIFITQIKSAPKIQEICTSEIRRLGSEFSEVPIMLAASLRDPTIIKYLVMKHFVNLNFVHKQLAPRQVKIKTPLIVAVRNSSYDTVEAILAMNADPNIADHKGRTALHHAVRKADYRMSKMLCVRGAQVNVCDKAENAPVHIATIFGHVELVKMLIHHGGDLFKKGQHGSIPIHIAAKEGHGALVRLFCNYEVNVNTKVPCYDEREKAPLHVAAEGGHAETVLALLEFCGADVNLQDSEGETPLHCISMREYDPLGMKSKDDFSETAKVLLRYGAHVDIRNKRGETALHLAARHEFQKTVDVLIQAGSDPLLEDGNGDKPVDLVSPDDTFSKQVIKAAMEESERVMSDALEIQAKGYTTVKSISSRSQSAINMAASLSNAELARTASTPGLLSSRFDSHHGVHEDGYLQPLGVHPRGALNAVAQIAQDRTQSTSSSGSRHGRSVGSDEITQKKTLTAQLKKMNKSKGSSEHLDRSTDSSHPSSGRGKKVKTSTPQDDSVKPPVRTGGTNAIRVLPSPPGSRRQNSFMSEDSSFWDVTPRTSASGYPFNQNEGTYETLPDDKIKSQGRPKQQQQQQQQQQRQQRVVAPVAKKTPLQFLPAFQTKNPQQEQTNISDSEDTFFDDESFDTLDTLSDHANETVIHRPDLAEQAARSAIQRTPEETRKIFHANKDPKIKTWVEDQIGWMQQREPDQTPTKKPAVAKKPKRVQDQGPTPPPPPRAPKPRVDRSMSASSNVSADTVIERPVTQSSRTDQQVLQLQVNESGQPGQTVIKIKPLQGRGSSPMTEMTETTEYTEDSYGYGRGQYAQDPYSVADSTSVTSHTTMSTDAVSDVRHSPRKNKTAPPPLAAKPKAVKGQQQQQQYQQQQQQQQQQQPVNSQMRRNNQKPNKVTNIASKRDSDGQDSSDSLSWISSDEEEQVDNKPNRRTQQQQQQQQQQQPPSVQHAQDPRGQTRQHAPNQIVFPAVDENVRPIKAINNAVPDRIGLGGPISESVADDYRLYKSLADINTNTSSENFRQKMQRKHSHGDILVSESQHGEPTQTQGGPYGQRPPQRQLQHPTQVHAQQPRHQTYAQPRDAHIEEDEEDSFESEDDDDDDDRASQKRVSIGVEEIIPNHPQGEDTRDHRTLVYDTDGVNPVSIVGGNAEGVFVSRVHSTSDAEEQGLREGDQILNVNGKRTRGKTREEVHLLLNGIRDRVQMVVRSRLMAYRTIVQSKGMGDSFFVKAHFSYIPDHKGEMAIKEGDIFSVQDTMPNGKMGLWKVVKLTATQKEHPEGMIPSKHKADQIAATQCIAHLRANEIKQRGGFIRKGFRRAKSLDRGGTAKSKEAEALAVKNVISYERVKQKAADRRRPVVLLGLFCDSVRDMLVKDSPDLFAVPNVEIESTQATGDPDDPPVQLDAIQAIVNRNQHCTIIVTPRAIQYLREHTKLDPIVIYLAPGNKGVVKVLKERYAPSFNRKASYMYDEAVSFAKQNADMFTDIVTYTSDEALWFKRLKEAIHKIQNSLTWQTVPPTSDDDDDDGEVANTAAGGGRRTATSVAREGREPQRRGRATVRASRTTDDIPDEIQDVISRHATGPSSGRSYSVGDSLGDTLDDSRDLGPKRPQKTVVNYQGYFVERPSNGAYTQGEMNNNVANKQRLLAASQAQSHEQYQPGAPRPILKNNGARSNKSFEIMNSSHGDETMSSSYYHEDNDATSTSSASSNQRLQRHAQRQPGAPSAAPVSAVRSSGRGQARRPRQPPGAVQVMGGNPYHQGQAASAAGPGQRGHQPQIMASQQQQYLRQTQAAPQFQVSRVQLMKVKVDQNWRKLMRTLLSNTYGDTEIDNIISQLSKRERKSHKHLEKGVERVLHAWAARRRDRVLSGTVSADDVPRFAGVTDATGVLADCRANKVATGRRVVSTSDVHQPRWVT